MPLKELDPARLPKHIAIIMDGNGRWAKKHGKPRSFGHKAGAKILKQVLRSVFSLKIPYLSLYAFSVDNWKRDPKEVSALIRLMKYFYKNDFKELKQNGVRVLHSGVYDRLPDEIITILKNIQEETKDNKNGTLNLCINYSSKLEITEGFKKFYNRMQTEKLPIESLKPEMFSEFLFQKEVPDVDLLIRTSNEFRISDFLLWQCAYAEFYFTPVLWPDFDDKELYLALKEYQNRNRRFGGAK